MRNGKIMWCHLNMWRKNNERRWDAMKFKRWYWRHLNVTHVCRLIKRVLRDPHGYTLNIILLTLVHRVQVPTISERIFKSKIACTRSCGRRMRFLLGAIRKIAAGSGDARREALGDIINRVGGVEQETSGKVRAGRVRRKSIARARWTRATYRYPRLLRSEMLLAHFFSPLNNNLSRSREKRNTEDRGYES